MRSVDVANLLKARPETVSRWNQGKAFPRPDAEKQLLVLEFIIDQLSDIYEPQEARMWLYSPQRLLKNMSPAELLQRGDHKRSSRWSTSFGQRAHLSPQRRDPRPAFDRPARRAADRDVRGDRVQGDPAQSGSHHAVNGRRTLVCAGRARHPLHQLGAGGGARGDFFPLGTAHAASVQAGSHSPSERASASDAAASSGPPWKSSGPT